MSLDSPLVIQAEVEDLELDKRLYQSLPAAVQQQWDKLQLAGRVSGKLDLIFDGAKWKPEAQITCHQVSAKPWLFLSRFTQVDGEIEYKNGTLSSKRMRGRASGQVVEAAFSLKHFNPVAQASAFPSLTSNTLQTNTLQTNTLPGSPQQGSSRQYAEISSGMPTGTQWLGTLRCRSLEWSPDDEDLVAALTPAGKPQEVEQKVRSISQYQWQCCTVNACFQRDSVDNPRWERTAEVNIYDGRIRYEKFRFPVYNIRGDSQSRR
ncbi:MAG: hypothetical protein U0930_10780 [Pirellulales bacterium]